MFRFCLLASGVAAGGPGIAADTAPEPAVELRAGADRWIELEKSIAAERNDWRAQKEALTSGAEVLKTEQAQLKQKLEAHELVATAFRNQLKNTEAELAAHEAAHAALAASCDRFEQRLNALLPRLPAPLRNRLEPWLVKLARAPAGAEDESPVSGRAQALVSALSAIDQFNNSITVVHELRPNGRGDTIDVKVLYWGLASAYAIDTSGAQAWIVTPGADGWTWRESPADAPAIAKLIAVHERTANPEFVVLPVGGEGGAP